MQVRDEKSATSSAISELAQKLQGGDEAAFEKLFHLYCQPLINFARRYVRDTATAESMVQEAFIELWSRRSKLDPSRNIKTYLYVSVRNNALLHLRHADVEQRGALHLQEGQPRVETPDELLAKQETQAAIQQAISELPEKRRIIFQMNRFDKLSYREIAEIKAISIKTVETQMGRALRYLRKRLQYLR